MIFGTGFFIGPVGAGAFFGGSLGDEDFLMGSEIFFDLAPLSFELGSTLLTADGVSFWFAVGGDWLPVSAAASLGILDKAGPDLEVDEPGLAVDEPGLEVDEPGLDELAGLVAPF